MADTEIVHHYQLQGDKMSKKKAQDSIDKLTDKKLKAIKPRDKRYRVYVESSPGLFLLVGVTGNITFQYRFQLNEQRREMKVGSYPAQSMADLMVEYSKLVAQVKQGIDPLHEKELEQQQAEDEPLFSEFAERFLNNYVKPKLKPSTIIDYERHINKYFIPAWKKRKLADIDRKQIIKLIEKLAKDAPIQANRKLSTLKKLFNYAVDVGVLNVSPANGIKPPATENVKDRVLNLNDLVAVFKLLDEQDNRDTKDVLKLIALTGQRPGEVAQMRVNQLSKEADGVWWCKSGQDVKNKTAHRVYLNEMALQIIQDRIKDFGLKKYIFPITKKNGTISFMRKDVTVSRTRKFMKLVEVEGLERFTAHDLRRSAATNIAMLGFASVVPDILNHKPQGITRQVYDKYSRQPEIRRALITWCETLQRAIDGTTADNVVTITANQ